MKLRWHLLSLFFAAIVAAAAWFYISGPLWSIDGYEEVDFAGYCPATRELHSLAVRDQGESWYFETRDVQDGRLLRETKLDKPPGRGWAHCFANADMEAQSRMPAVIVQSNRTNTPFFQCYLFDRRTGVSVAEVPLSMKERIMPEVSNCRIAIATERGLWLIDENNIQGSALYAADIECMAISHDGNYIAYLGQDGVHMIDCKTKKNTLALGRDKSESASSISFQRDGKLLLSRYSSKAFRVSRWRWNGECLQSDSTVFSTEGGQGSHFIGSMLMKEQTGCVHVASFVYLGWPSSINVICGWLQSKGVNVKNWLPLKTRLQWHVLDENHREINRYEELALGHKPLSTRLSVNYYGLNEKNTRIEVWVTSPQWPNLLALGMMVYLLIYVLALCMGLRAENVAEA